MLGEEDLPWKPLAQWNRGDLLDYCSDTKSLKWLRLAIHPELSLAVAGYYRERSQSPEEEVWTLADQQFKAPDKSDPYLLRAVARWFLRNYSLWYGLVLYSRLVRCPGQRPIDRMAALGEALMPRVFVSVWIGMLAVCGSSPWAFFEALSPESRGLIIWLCLAFTLVYRVVHIARRSSAGFFAVAGRSLALSAYGWGFGWALFVLFVWLYRQAPGKSDQEVARHVWETYRLLMPSLGSAVGVILQELWEDKPISEPL